MMPSEFNIEINRLKDVYGDRAFPDARVQLVWSGVKQFSGHWFKGVCDGFIGNMRQAPVLSDFMQAASIERERNWAQEKAEHARDAKNFFLISDDPTMRQSTLKTILDRMNGKVPDDVWNDFMEGLNKLVGASERAARGRP